MNWLFAILNWIFFRRRCFFCDKLVDINCNIIQYKTSDYSEKLQSAYVCSECSKDVFVTKELADIYNVMGEKDEDRIE